MQLWKGRFKKELSKATDIHKTYKSQNINATTTWKSQTQADFEEFEREGVVSKDFKKILKLLE